MQLELEPEPGPAWVTDGAIRWLIIEGATEAETSGLFELLNADGIRIATQAHSNDPAEWREEAGYSIISLISYALPRPTIGTSRRPAVPWKLVAMC